MQPSLLERLPDDITNAFGAPLRLVERELITIWRKDKKGEWYSIRFVQSRAVPS